MFVDISLRSTGEVADTYLKGLLTKLTGRQARWRAMRHRHRVSFLVSCHDKYDTASERWYPFQHLWGTSAPPLATSFGNVDSAERSDGSHDCQGNCLIAIRAGASSSSGSRHRWSPAFGEARPRGSLQARIRLCTTLERPRCPDCSFSCDRVAGWHVCRDTQPEVGSG